MAYHLTGYQTMVAATRGKLQPVASGLDRMTSEDIRVPEAIDGNWVAMPKGTEYLITGTKDGDGYVVTIKGGETHYFSANTGWKLC